jgi:hypothetical protein
MYPDVPTKPNNFEGGVTGAAKILQIQAAADEAKQRDIEASLRKNADDRAGQYLDLSKQSATRLQSQQDWEHKRMDDNDQAARESRATQARSLQSQKMQEAVKDGVSYQADVAAAIPKVQSARTRQEYEANIAAVKGIYTGAVTRGLKVDPVTIPPFRGDVITEAQKAFQATSDPNEQNAIRARLNQMGIDPVKEAGLPADSSIPDYGN